MATKKKTDDQEKNVSSEKLEILITIVNRKKGEFYADLIMSFEANFQFKVLGQGTASEQVKSLLGWTSSEKIVIFSVLSKENATKALQSIEEKFASIKDGKGIAFTISLSSVIGKSIYAFLSNNKTIVGGE